jgi:carboxypeptidase PM20D1
LLFLAVLLIRAAAFKPKADNYYEPQGVDFDGDKAVENLCELVRFKTVSYRDASLEGDAEFKKLIAKLPTLYPMVFKTCEYKELPDRALLFKWSGKSSSEPSVMMAHYDVVPADESAWASILRFRGRLYGRHLRGVRKKERGLRTYHSRALTN